MSSCVTDGSGLVCTIWNKIICTLIVVVSIIANAPDLHEQHVSLCTRHCIGTLAISGAYQCTFVWSPIGWYTCGC